MWRRKPLEVSDALMPLRSTAPEPDDDVLVGGGLDRVLVDSKDVTSDCERGFTRPGAYFESISSPSYDYFAPFYS